MEKFDIPSDYCSLAEKVRTSILELCESIIKNGSTVKFNGKDFRDFNDLKMYLDHYCEIEVPKREEEIIEIIKKWKNDHSSFYK